MTTLCKILEECITEVPVMTKALRLLQIVLADSSNAELFRSQGGMDLLGVAQRLRPCGVEGERGPRELAQELISSLNTS